MSNKIISLFNHKGGVGKTTFTYNVAWHLASKGKKVLLIDADPQCNLTGLVHGFSEDIDYDLFNSRAHDVGQYKSIYEYLTPKLFAAANNDGANKELYSHYLQPISLLSGDIRASQYDFEFIDAIKSRSMATRHLPYAFENAIRELGKDFDYTFIDLSPNLGVFNMFTVMSSDYFLVPIFPSFFSLQAIDNLKSIFKQWNEQIDYYRPDGFNHIGIKARPKFLGIVSQNFRKYDKGDADVVAKSFKEWENKVNLSAKEFANSLTTYDMAITEREFTHYFENEKPFCIARISDFNQLKTVSEKHGIPVVGLGKNELSQEGIATPYYEEQIKSYSVIFDGIVKGLMKL